MGKHGNDWEHILAGFEPGGREFESLQARHYCSLINDFPLLFSPPQMSDVRPNNSRIWVTFQ